MPRVTRRIYRAPGETGPVYNPNVVADTCPYWISTLDGGKVCLDQNPLELALATAGLSGYDDVWRAPGELPPRMNAYGGLGSMGIVIAPTPGDVPGGRSVLPVLPHFAPPKPAPTKPAPVVSQPPKTSPAPGTRPAPVVTTGATPPSHSTGPSPVVTTGTNPPTNRGGGSARVLNPPLVQFPKPGSTTSTTTTGCPTGQAPDSSGNCAPYTAANCPVYTGSGYYVDASGNCTNDWANPYDESLPASGTPAPSPTVSTNGCPTGYQQDAYGNCVVTSQTCPSGLYPDDNGNCIPFQGAGGSVSSWLSNLEQWLGEQTIVSGVPNYWFAGGGSLLVLYLMFRKKR